MALADLERRRNELVEQMASLGDMRRGSLTERYIPCGKPGCRCTKPGNRWPVSFGTTGRIHRNAQKSIAPKKCLKTGGFFPMYPVVQEGVDNPYRPDRIPVDTHA